MPGGRTITRKEVGRTGAARLGLLAVLAAAAPAWAQDEVPASERPRPEITIDPGGVSPEALRSITDAVDAIARLADDQDGGEASRLRRRARDATLSALTTQGYFSSRVALEAGSDVVGETWDITIDPGDRTRVQSVEITPVGRLAHPQFAARMQALRDGWLLRPGEPFINAKWNEAKGELLDAASAKDFFMARLSHTRAQIDPDTAQAKLYVTLDSGPLVRLGPTRISGLKRVPESLVDRYVRYEAGTPYEREDFETWQQQLQATSFFRGAFVQLGRPGAKEGDAPLAADVEGVPGADARVAEGSTPSPAPAVQGRDEIELPVLVQLVEAPARRASFGLGVDDSVGLRAEALYRQNIVLGLPLTMETGIGVDRRRQRAFLDFYLPADEKGRRDSVGVLAHHSDIEGLKVTRLALGAYRQQERRGAGTSRVEYETRWGGLLAHDDVRIRGGDSYTLPTATLTADWLRRDVNDKYDPREGNLIAAGAGVGVTLDSGKPYTRIRLRAQQWWPIGPRDVITVRAEGGRVWSDGLTQVPDDFGFRTGGARTVRGYKYMSLGQKRDRAVVGARTLAVASAEYTHYFDERFGMAAFVDVGDAAESFRDMNLAWGYGVGARVRTPAGPLALDLAWGQRDQQLRLHFSLGIAF